MLLLQLFYRVAFVVTGFIHLYFNDLIQGVITVVTLCLSDSKQPILQSILRLHSTVLVGFMLAFCFNTASAHADQRTLGERHHTIRVSLHSCPVAFHLTAEQFDDIPTRDGFASVPAGYHNLTFDNFFAFKPTDPSLEGVISVTDLNCAVSKPNALYGSKVGIESPAIQPYDESQTFTVNSLKIKPLDLPVGIVRINLHGSPANSSESLLLWNVDFPAGFHDMLHVQLEEFSKVSWTGLIKLEIWAEFYYTDVEMDDWEFCIDDLDVEIDRFD